MRTREDVSETEVNELVSGLELLLLDVDGVLTDGRIILTGANSETKNFDVKDGMGITLAQRAGIDVGIVTGRVSEVVRRRAGELDIDQIYQGYSRKKKALGEITEQTDLSTSEMAFVGDDVPDLAIMNEVGLSLAPGDAHPAVRKSSLLTMESNGGDGAIREAVDYFLELREQKEKVYNSFSR
ncbi:MAG: KdsC family phosphatase [bacterium]